MWARGSAALGPQGELRGAQMGTSRTVQGSGLLHTGCPRAETRGPVAVEHRAWPPAGHLLQAPALTVWGLWALGCRAVRRGLVPACSPVLRCSCYTRAPTTHTRPLCLPCTSWTDVCPSVYLPSTSPCAQGRAQGRAAAPSPCQPQPSTQRIPNSFHVEWQHRTPVPGPSTLLLLSHYYTCPSSIR